MAKAKPASVDLSYIVEGLRPLAVPIESLTLDPENARRHGLRNVRVLEQSLVRFHQHRPLVVQRGTGVVLAGNGLLEAARKLGRTHIAVVEVEATGAEARALALADNRTAELSEWNQPVLSSQLAQLLDDAAWDLPALGWDLAEVEALLPGMASVSLAEMEEALGTGAEVTVDDWEGNDAPAARPRPERAAIPHALWPSDNEWGVPLLRMDMQATHVALPAIRWGRVSRHNTQHSGTWYFYTDDEKFAPLWVDPSPVPRSGATVAVEPNFSTHKDSPLAEALWDIYRKRWVARWWQDQGVRVLVDLNVHPFPQLQALNLLGVPKGWGAYATRGYASRLDELEADFEIACSHAGRRDPLFAVVTTGRAAEDMCRARGWTLIRAEHHVLEGRE